MASSGSNGSVTPAGTTAVGYDLSQSYTITPAAHYHVADVLVDGSSVGAVSSYDFTHVTAGHTISASFAIDTFAAIYDSQGGTAVASGSYSFGGSFALASAPTRSGYVFNGWFVASSGGSVLTSPYAPGLAADITLYAQWTLIPTISTVAAVTGSSGPLPGTNTVTLTGTGYTGTASVTIDGQPCTNIVITSDTQITCTVPAGISVGPKDVVIAAPGGSVTSIGGYTYYATVTFNANSGTGSMVNQTGTSAAALHTNAFTKAGSIFAGWSTTSNGSVSYANGASFAFTNDQTLFAKWTLVPTISTVAAVTGSSGPLPGTNTVTLTGTGYTGTTSVTIDGQACTNIVVTGDTQITCTVPVGISVGPKDVVITAPGGSVTSIGGYTYFATVTFLANSGVGAMSNQTGFSATSLHIDTFTKTGYTFAGWATSPSGSVLYTDGAVFPFVSDQNLYAQWTLIPIINTVVFDANRGIGSMAPQHDIVPAALNASTFTRANYTFGGWTSSADGSGTFYGNAAVYPFNQNITLFAKWIADKHTISFDGNKPTAGNSPSPVGPVDFGSTIKAPGNSGPLTKDGYSFGGWNTTPDGTGTDYSVGSDIPVGGDVTLYAKWIELPKHTVLFTGNGSTAGLSAAEISYRPANLVPNGFTRDGYKFVGWSTAADGAGTSYADGALYSFESDLTLYAQWSQNQSTTPPSTNPGPIVTEGTDDVKATEDGADDPVVVTILNGGTGIQVATKTWKIGIQSDKKVVEGIQVPSKLKVYLIRGVNATTSGDGFMPGTIANVYLYSTKLFLGKALVRPDGTFAATFPVSAKTTLGHHVMQVEGTSYDGKFRTAAVGLTVIDLPLGKQVPISMIFYDLNVSDLNATNRAKLDKVSAKQIVGHFRKIWIFGYTDIQTGVDNQALSAARAKKVTDYLHKKLPKVQIVFKYFGPANPRNPAHTQAAYAQNRRSEILGQR